jgi:hypothetical protein
MILREIIEQLRCFATVVYNEAGRVDKTKLECIHLPVIKILKVIKIVQIYYDKEKKYLQNLVEDKNMIIHTFLSITKMIP